MIKRYPGGRFSGMLGEQIAVGTELGFTGPYGAFHLRESERPILMIAGGSGMAPVLAVLRQLAAPGLPATGALLLRGAGAARPVRSARRSRHWVSAWRTSSFTP